MHAAIGLEPQSPVPHLIVECPPESQYSVSNDHEQEEAATDDPSIGPGGILIDQSIGVHSRSDPHSQETRTHQESGRNTADYKGEGEG